MSLWPLQDSEEGHADHLAYGLAAMQGWRVSMVGACKEQVANTGGLARLLPSRTDLQTACCFPVGIRLLQLLAVLDSSKNVWV